MIRKYISLFYLFCFVLLPAHSQTNVCYSNCKNGYCKEKIPSFCTACDQGQININGKCVSDSRQPFPIQSLTIAENNKLNETARFNEYFNCTIQNDSNSVALGTIFYWAVPGATFTKSITIAEKHQYVRFKLNAASIVVGLFLTVEATLFDQEGKRLTQVVQINERPQNSNVSLMCKQIQVQNVFFIEGSVGTQQSNLILQIKSSDSQSMFGISNIEIYYGSCHHKCKRCSGPISSECLQCQGLYLKFQGGRCVSCREGFYDVGNQCRACPFNCKLCNFNNQTQLISCSSCRPHAELNGSECNTKFLSQAFPSDLIYKSAYGWQSTELSSQPLTICGRYSLIGGLSVGKQRTMLLKTFTNLQVHSIVDIYLTFWIIDKVWASADNIQIFIDGQLAKNETLIAAPVSTNSETLTNQCGDPNFQVPIVILISNISHYQRNLTVSMTTSNSYFGFRDFSLVVRNKTDCIGCYQQQNGKCVSCLNAFLYDPFKNTCRQCAKGYYLSHFQTECIICPFQCQTCSLNSETRAVDCDSCYEPLQMRDRMCTDPTKSVYSREIIPYDHETKYHHWILYPKLPENGITTCAGQTILGSEKDSYKFLTMKREFRNLPAHKGIQIYFHLYQIDNYTKNSVAFVLNGKNISYTPSVIRKQICGEVVSLDAIVKINLQDNLHTQPHLVFEIRVNGRIKIGISNFLLMLLNTEQNNQVPFQIQSLPIYSVRTPPIKGIMVKVLFNEKIYNSTPLAEIFNISIRDSNGQPLQKFRLLQGLTGQNTRQAQSQKLTRNMEYSMFYELEQDYNLNQLNIFPVGFWDLSSDEVNGHRKLLESSLASKQMPRYIDIDMNSVNNRKNIRNLKGFFQGCAILALWVGLFSFIFGLSSVFDDFFSLVQVLFVHIFIQLAYSPPSFRVPLEGMQIVQFMAWLPWSAREQIEKGIIADNLYQRTPIQFEQYYKDIVFVRTIYHTILFILFMLVLFFLLKIMTRLISSVRFKPKFADTYIVKYYSDYHNLRFSFIDKFVRFAYFTVMWACLLQFNAFYNEPQNFNIGNSVFCILIFIVFSSYPIVGTLLLFRISQIVSAGTFSKIYKELRVRPGMLPHFFWRYFRLFIIALLISLAYKVNLLGILIPLIIIHIADGVIIIVLKPFGMQQQQEQLNVLFYNYYPKVYQITSIVQSFLFAFLQLFILITWAVRDYASSFTYLALGYFCCAIVIVLLLNGLVRLASGFIKIVQQFLSKSKEMKLQVETKEEKEKEINQEMAPIKSAMRLQTQIGAIQSQLKKNTKKSSYVSRIS